MLDATWIEHHELHTEEELCAFAGFAARLMSEGRNEGETAVLAIAATMPARAADTSETEASEHHVIEML